MCVWYHPSYGVHHHVDGGDVWMISHFIDVCNESEECPISYLMSTKEPIIIIITISCNGFPYVWRIATSSVYNTHCV